MGTGRVALANGSSMVDDPRRNPARGRILVVDDDAEVRRVVGRLVELEGYTVSEVATGRDATKAAESQTHDLILLDVMLDGEDGFDVLTAIRKVSDVPVILLTARTGETDRVLGLRLGADDYIPKPFSGPELAARITSVLRRYNRSTPDGMLQFHSLSIDMKSREVAVDGRVIQTTLKEFDLLAFLAGSPRQVFTREQVLDQVWGSSSAWQDEGTVTEHIRRIRQKLAVAGFDRNCIRTVRGVGYRFEP